MHPRVDDAHFKRDEDGEEGLDYGSGVVVGEVVGEGHLDIVLNQQLQAKLHQDQLLVLAVRLDEDADLRAPLGYGNAVRNQREAELDEFDFELSEIRERLLWFFMHNIVVPHSIALLKPLRG